MWDVFISFLSYEFKYYESNTVFSLIYFYGVACISYRNVLSGC